MSKSDPLFPQGPHRLNSHRKWQRSASRSLRNTERAPELRSARLQPSKKYPPQSLLERMSFRKPRLTMLLDRISESSSSMTNPLMSQHEMHLMEERIGQKPQMNLHLAPSVQDLPNQLQELRRYRSLMKQNFPGPSMRASQEQGCPMTSKEPLISSESTPKTLNS